MTDASQSQGIAALKARLRSEALARRDALEIDDRLIWDEAISESALALFETLLAEASDPVVSAYWPMRSEADPRPILEGLHAKGVALALPAIVEGVMVFRQWAPYEPIVPGGFGTLVPDPQRPQRRPTHLIVPLAAFDRRGCRIGYGKGHFDTALAALAPCVSVGIAYAAQEIETVPVEGHDRALDWIVTEAGTFHASALSR